MASAALSPAARRLYDAALELFYERGSLGTSVRDIASKCGLTQGALYNHFASKEELLHVIIRDAHQVLEAQVVRARSESDNPADQLAAVIRVYVEFHAAHPHAARIASLEFRHLSPPRTQEIVAIRRRLRGHAVKILRDGRSSGAFNPPPGDRVSDALTAATILDMCINITEWFHDRHPWSVQRLVKHFSIVALRIAGASTTS